MNRDESAAAKFVLAMVGVRAVVACVCDQLHGPTDAGEFGGADYAAVRAETGAIRESRVGVRMGLRRRFDCVRLHGGPILSALGISSGAAAVVSDGVFRGAGQRVRSIT